MRKASYQDKDSIIEVLKKNIFDNVYLYIDVITFDVDNDKISLWAKKHNDRIVQVLLKYHDSFQIYAERGQLDFSGVLGLIDEYDPLMISGKAETISSLFKHLSGKYSERYGKVLTQPYNGIYNYDTTPEMAGIHDMEEIARLICSDYMLGAHYHLNDLRDQFVQRFENQLGRNFIIRQNGKIVAHHATYAEAPDIAIMGGLIVDQEYRRYGYGIDLYCWLADMLARENKTAVLFCNEDLLKFYINLGAVVCSDNGKLTKK